MLAGNRSRTGEQRPPVRSDTDNFTDYLYSQPTDFDVVERVAEVAKERDVPPAQVALAWLLQRPGVTAPIVGATKPGHLEDALAAEDAGARPTTRSPGSRSSTFPIRCWVTSEHDLDHVAAPRDHPRSPPTAVDFHLDIMCPYAFQTSLWIREVRDPDRARGALALLQP